MHAYYDLLSLHHDFNRTSARRPGPTVDSETCTCPRHWKRLSTQGHAHLHPMTMIKGWTCIRIFSTLSVFLFRNSDFLVPEWNDVHQRLGCVCFPCQQVVRCHATFDVLAQPRHTLRETAMVDMPADPVKLHHNGNELACVGRNSCPCRAHPRKDTLPPLPCPCVGLSLGRHRAIFCRTRET